MAFGSVRVPGAGFARAARVGCGVHDGGVTRRDRSGRRSPNRRATRKPIAPRPAPLRVAIVTSPGSTGGEIDLRHELRLIRSALLYADEVELVSPASEMLAGLHEFSQGTGDDFLALMLSLDDSTMASLGAGAFPAG